MSLVTANQLDGQSDAKQYSVDLEGLSYDAALKKLIDVTGVSIVYSNRFFDRDHLITKSYGNRSLEDILDDLLSQVKVAITLKGSIFVISKIKEERYNLHGYILDSDSGERLPFATIYCTTTEEVFSSNEEGFYSFPLTSGNYNFKIFYLGHITAVVDVQLLSHQREDIPLLGENLLPEIVIDEEKASYLSNDRNKYAHDKLMRLATRSPGLGGSNDLLQTARVLPGVQSGSGGAGGYFIRGGSNDQNLFLLDGVTVYNPFHALGLSSIFTPHTTKSLQIYKSGFRAQYGDKSSSVIDVRLKDGNRQKLEGAAGYNPQDAFVQMEGPISKGRSSFLLYGRTSTLAFKFNDVIRNSIFPNNISESHTNYFDVIGKVNVGIGGSNKLFATFYQGRDRLKGEDEEEEESSGVEESSEEAFLSWGNQIVSLRWQSLLSPSLFLNVSASRNNYFSNYGTLSYVEGADDELRDLQFTSVASSNRDYDYNIVLDHSPSTDMRLKVGVGYLKKAYMPDFAAYNENSEELNEVSNLQFSSLDSLSEATRLVSDKWYQFIEGTWSKGSLVLQAGLRTTYFTFEDDSFFHLQPRLGLDYSLNSTDVISASLSKVVQYVHLLSSSEVNLPRDLWYPAYKDLPPEETWHYNLAFNKLLGSGMSISTEVYYKHTEQKTVTSQVPFEESVSIQNLFSNVGRARSYGVELGLDIVHGIWEGSAAYAISKSNRNFNGINLGRTYDFQFDRIHELKTVNSFQITNNLVLGLGVYFGTGHPLLVTTGLDPNTGIKPIDINDPGQKNTQRTGLQHRVDFSLLYTKNTGPLIHHLKFNLYNTYNQNSPLFFTKNPNVNDELVPRFSLPLVPSLSYTITF